MTTTTRFSQPLGGYAATPATDIILRAAMTYEPTITHEIRSEIRREALRSRSVSPEQWLVPGSLELLERLKAEDVQLFLASGTDEVYVKEEVRLLGLDHYFEDRVFGAIDDYRRFSKAQIIEKILAEHIQDARQLMGFGDGYVEIQNLVEAGATAVGVASDEKNRGGQIDAWKRERLASVGAHLIVPDFSEAEQLLRCLGAGQT